MIKEYIASKKPLIDDKIRSIISQQKDKYHNINQFADESFDKLADFCVSGKSLRGVLVLLGTQMYGKEIDDNALNIASILEIIHSSILIQDDIQDDDQLRRGNPTVFYQYQQFAIEHNFRNPKFYGQSIAIDTFMIGHYSALEYFSKLDLDGYEKMKLFSFFTQEMVKIQIAQTQDIYHGYVHANKVSIEDIENVQLYKTGRYTLSLPLMLGGLYAGKNVEDMKDIEMVGEMLGLVFQIKDDELSIFADEGEIGKKVGNDIAENKKTHYRELLYQRADTLEKMFLKTAFGNKHLSDKKLNKVRELMEKYNIRTEMQDKMNSIGNEAKKIIETMDVPQDNKTELISLVDYLLTRTK